MSLAFERKVSVKKVEKRHSAKGKDYSIVVVEGDDGRTLDFYHDGIITMEENKIHNLLFDYKFSYGKGSLVVVGIK